MRHETITLNTVHELCDQAKKRAYQDYLNEDFSNFYDPYNQASLKQFESIFPIKIEHWYYDATRGHIGFSMQESDQISYMYGLRLSKYLYNNYWHRITKRKYYGKLVNTFEDGTPIPLSKEHPAGLRHLKHLSKCTRESSCPLTGYYMDDVLLDPIFQFIRKPDKTTFKDLMRKCLDAWIDACIKDMAYQGSMECFIETAEAYEWEFLENGERWYHIQIAFPNTILKRA